MASINFSSSWPSCFSLCFPDKPGIKKQIKDFATEKNLTWNTERQNLVLEALKPKHYYSCASHLKKICQSLKPSELHQLLRTVASDISPTPGQKEIPNVRFNHLKLLLSLEQIEKAIQSEHPNFETSLKIAKEMSSHAKYYLEINHPAKAQPIINKAIHNIIWGIESAIDTALSLFGYDMLSKDAESSHPMEAHYRLESVLTIVSGITAAITLAITITGSALLGVSIVGAAIALGTALLALYFKFLKPAPRTIKGCQNFSAQAAAGTIAPLKSQQEYIDRVAATVIASTKKPKVHALLIGQSGVGKTEILKGFAQCVAAGRYPELKGKQVFYVNAADLNHSISAGSLFDQPVTIEKIRDRIRHRREDVILIIDEAHQLVQGSKNGNLAEKFKTLLDDGEEGFPYLIAATTDEEYIRHILQGNENDEDNPLARRFRPIPIEEMNKDQTLAVLNKMILKETGLQVSSDAIEKAYDLSKEHFPNRPQPYMACRILAQAISQVRDNHTSKFQKELSVQESLLEKNRSSLLLRPGLGLFADDFRIQLAKENSQIQARITELNDQIKKEKTQATTLKELITKLESSKEKFCKLATEIDSQSPLKASKKTTELLKEFALTAYYMNWAWDNAVQTHMQQNGQRFAHIDLPLIKHVVETELKEKERSKKMLKKAGAKNLAKNESKKMASNEADDDLENIKKLKGRLGFQKILKKRK